VQLNNHLLLLLLRGLLSTSLSYAMFPLVQESHDSKYPNDRIKERFNCDYSRWSDSSFRPDDPVTIEKTKENKSLKEPHIDFMEIDCLEVAVERLP
jgi:hypothetical protein